MILIISEENDYSTNEVIDWLSFYKKKYLRINTNEINDSNINITMKNL